jgi:LysM repeat protein
MSVATEFPPDVHIPAAARPRSLRVVPAGADPTAYVAKRSPGPAAPAAAALGAGVIDLDRWRHQFVGAQAGDRRRNDAGLRTRPEPASAGSAAFSSSAPASIRLTRLGTVVIAVASLVTALAVVAIAWLSAPTGTAAPSAASGPSLVTVHSGDSLWTIAGEVAPDRDPRVEIAELRQLNHLADDTVTPGQQLRVR